MLKYDLLSRGVKVCTGRFERSRPGSIPGGTTLLPDSVIGSMTRSERVSLGSNPGRAAI